MIHRVVRSVLVPLIVIGLTATALGYLAARRTASLSKAPRVFQ